MESQRSGRLYSIIAISASSSRPLELLISLTLFVIRIVRVHVAATPCRNDPRGKSRANEDTRPTILSILSLASSASSC